MIDFLSLKNIESYDLSSLEAIGGGGAQMPLSLAERMENLLGLDYIEAYGLTETMAPIHINPITAPRKQCLGIPIFDVDSRIIEPKTENELGPNEIDHDLLLMLSINWRAARRTWSDPSSSWRE